MIGIVTYYETNNYGANLQAFALQKIISIRGKNVCILKYPNNPICKREKKKIHNQIKETKNLYQKFIIIIRFIKSKLAFIHFRNKYIRPQYINKSVTKIIVGSDQVWNTEINNGDPYYYLNFFNNSKYSYAASFGIESMSLKYEDTLIDYLRKFKNIGIREESGKKYLYNEYGIYSTITLDPTLLIKKEEWIRYFNIFPKNKDYLFLFIIGNVSPYLQQYLKKHYSDKLEINWNNQFISDNIIKNIPSGSPQKWLSYLAYSEIVVTNSYHGVLFSILFHKNFILYYKNSYKYINRHWDFFKLLNIQGKKVRINNEECLFIPNLNYNLIDIKIAVLRKKSFDYLDSIIKDQDTQ